MASAPRLPPRRLLVVSALATALGGLMAFGAKAILWLIAAITNLSFYGRLSAAPITPTHHHLGAWVILVPTAGGILVGLMARYGSRGIQGHGIPEAMEQVLFKESRVEPRILALKPLSTAVVIGTGGPFGAEGVVIATGGALGSLIGQRLAASPLERKILLAAGAAAGLSAAFGAPIAAVLLAVELLLFEFHPRSLIPVSLASAAAAALRAKILSPGPLFAIPPVTTASSSAFLPYAALGLFMGLLAVAVVGAVAFVERGFERLPIHWMWLPAAGALAIGLLGWSDPRVFGPGYDLIGGILSGGFGSEQAVHIGALKLAAWILGVASATSSGTLAPLLLIGAGAGLGFARVFSTVFHAAALDPRLAALVGLAAFFGGISGAFLSAMMLAIETTWQAHAFMPLLTSCSVSYLVCRLLSNENIMTQKFARQGRPVPAGYAADDPPS
ncbi:MAG: chloride channel protein [Elusimicrobia bacterium]|nr:chloride channel protein [Elusimicrobiota bacterium]MDE2425036.1 chloride channel protein [Elusimicrobiota bacterium]